MNHFTELNLKKVALVQENNMKMGIPDIGLVLKAVISQCLQLTLCKIYVRQCVMYLKRWELKLKCIIMKSRLHDDALQLQLPSLQVHYTLPNVYLAKSQLEALGNNRL